MREIEKSLKQSVKEVNEKNFLKQQIKYLRENGILITEIALAISTKSKSP